MNDAVSTSPGRHRRSRHVSRHRERMFFSFEHIATALFIFVGLYIVSVAYVLASTHYQRSFILVMIEKIWLWYDIVIKLLT